MSPILLWFRRDFRLSDHAALTAAVETGQHIIPIFILDEQLENLGAAPKWRLGEALEEFSQLLAPYGQKLILRRGHVLAQIKHLLAETSANTVFWSRAYDPDNIARDKAVKADLQKNGVTAKSFAGHLLYEPWLPMTKTGEAFKVYTPFWRAVSRGFEVDQPLPAPSKIPAPTTWPRSERLSDWGLGQAMHTGAGVVAKHALIGAKRAQDKLDNFLTYRVKNYPHDRDYPAVQGTSNLSEPLAYGEISPREIYHKARLRLGFEDASAHQFLKELVWREFAYHLLWHFPNLSTQNWRQDWDAFPWQGLSNQAQAWQYGQTGEDFVDAGMRELYVTGRLHNRLRMIVGSYLTKHLMVNWRVGLNWFAQCLTDWDPASNAMGWQWIAGCGPDAAPYFRVFNPRLQGERFDPERKYMKYWLTGEGREQFAQALPKGQQAGLLKRPSTPIVSLQKGREQALAAYQTFKAGQA